MDECNRASFKLTFRKTELVFSNIACLNACLLFSWWYGIQCFFGGAGCNSSSGIRGTVFILMYVLSYVGGANLLRHAEGATWLAIVTVRELVTTTYNSIAFEFSFRLNICKANQGWNPFCEFATFFMCCSLIKFFIRLQ